MKGTAGGKFLAHERMTDDAQIEHVSEVPILGSDRREPLVKRLAPASLQAVADLLGVSIFELEKRYEVS